MTQLLNPPERSTFFDKSPTLTQGAALAKYALWQSGAVVRSEITAVGLLVPSLDEETLLASRYITKRNYDTYRPIIHHYCHERQNSVQHFSH